MNILPLKSAILAIATSTIFAFSAVAQNAVEISELPNMQAI